jgi:HSP20 family protein
MRQNLMPKKKETTEEVAKKTEVTVTKKKSPEPSKPSQEPSAVVPVATSNIWRAFDDIFGRFRNDFEELFFPSTWASALSLIPEIRVPVVDLEDREKDYLLKAEMPGFKKEDIEIDVENDSIAISGKVGWKYDKKAQSYICKERACESFSRMVQLPEEIKVDGVKANLTEGVFEITLPKKTQKQKRKVKIE